MCQNPHCINDDQPCAPDGDGHCMACTRANFNPRPRHEWDDEAICIHCGYDGADAAWQQLILKAEIGPDEFKSRWNMGEFDSDRFCTKRPVGETS